jgi:hypothetical protein
MKRRFSFVWLAAMLAAVLVLPAAGAAKTAIPAGTTGYDEVFAYFNFEKDIAPWTPMTDSPFHGYKLGIVAGANGCPDGAGNHVARLVTASKINLNPLDILKYGSWTSARFMVGGDGARLVTVKWSARWSPDLVPSPITGHPAAYAGLKSPAKGTDFIVPPKSALTYNWQTFKYQTTIVLPPNHPATGTPVHIALGWDNVSDSMDLDCASIAITYSPTTR